MKTFLLTTAIILTTASMALASGRADSPQAGDMGNSGHVDGWHGTGDDHQAGNNPGDTANDRHGFGGTATPSGVNPANNNNGD